MGVPHAGADMGRAFSLQVPGTDPAHKTLTCGLSLQSLTLRFHPCIFCFIESFKNNICIATCLSLNKWVLKGNISITHFFHDSWLHHCCCLKVITIRYNFANARQ